MGFLNAGLDPSSGVAQSLERSFLTGFQSNEARHAREDESIAKAQEITLAAKARQQERLQKRADDAEGAIRTARTKGQEEQLRIALMPLEAQKAVLQKGLENGDIANKSDYERSLADIGGIMSDLGTTFMTNLEEIARNPLAPKTKPYAIPKSRNVAVTTENPSPLSLGDDNLRLQGGTTTRMQPQGFIPQPVLTPGAKTEQALKGAQLQHSNLTNMKLFSEMGTTKVDPVAAREETKRIERQGEDFQKDITGFGDVVGGFESSYRTFAEELKKKPEKSKGGGLLGSLGESGTSSTGALYDPSKADAVSKAYNVRTGYQKLISNIQSGQYDKYIPGASEVLTGVDKSFEQSAKAKGAQHVPASSISRFDDTISALDRVTADPSAPEHIRKAAGVIRERLSTHQPRVRAIRESMDYLLK